MREQYFKGVISVPHLVTDKQYHKNMEPEIMTLDEICHKFTKLEKKNGKLVAICEHCLKSIPLNPKNIPTTYRQHIRKHNIYDKDYGIPES